VCLKKEERKITQQLGGGSNDWEVERLGCRGWSLKCFIWHTVKITVYKIPRMKEMEKRVFRADETPNPPCIYGSREKPRGALSQKREEVGDWPTNSVGRVEGAGREKRGEKGIWRPEIGGKGSKDLLS